MKKASKSYKIIVDSNIWISFLIGKNLSGLQNLSDSRNLKIITCKEQLTELAEVFKKPELKKYFSKEQVAEFFDIIITGDKDLLELNLIGETTVLKYSDFNNIT